MFFFLIATLTIDPRKLLSAASFLFSWTRCHVHMLSSAVTLTLQRHGVFLLLYQQVIGMLVWPAGDSASKPNTSACCPLLRLQQSLLSYYHMFYVRNTLRFTHFTLCGNFILFFPLVGWDSLENVLFLLLFICILGCVLLMVLLLGYLIVVKNCWMWYIENSWTKKTLEFFSVLKKNLFIVYLLKILCRLNRHYCFVRGKQ